MKAHIIHNTRLDKKGLAEIQELTGYVITTEYKRKMIPAVYNPYFKQLWGNFNWLRSLFTNPTDVRCFLTTKQKLKDVGITSHIGMYDMVDKDGVIDFYIGVLDKLDKRAKKSGFKTNLAWLFVHEMLHGKEQNAGNKDRTHAMDNQGRLKELLLEHLKIEQRISKPDTKKQNTLIALAKKLIGLFAKVRITQEDKLDGLQPIVRRKAEALIKEMTTQGYIIDITSGYRGQKAQDALYEQGRTKAGSIVTNARYGDSSHNYGVAFDCAFMVNGKPSWSNSHPWELLGSTGEKLGLTWGGRWSSFVDRPHFQYLAGYTLNDFKKGIVNKSKLQ